MFSLVSRIAHRIKFVQDIEVRCFLWERECFDVVDPTATLTMISLAL
jgi:hypothetical protein